jgi:Fic family protein
MFVGSHKLGYGWTMTDLRALVQLERLVAAERELLGAFEVESSSEFAALRIDEIRLSCALAGIAMAREDVAALVLRGVATGTRALDDIILVADYAQAAAYVAASSKAGLRRRFVTVEEIVELHTRALRRVPAARPGQWRRTTVPAFASGMVAPPAWLVPRDVERYADRIGSGPPPGESVFLWVAAAHERFLRIQPFARGNGRVGRLLANLLLRRVDLPPFFVSTRERTRYYRALRDADARDHAPLATLIARSLLANMRRLLAAVDRRDEFVALAELAEPQEREALYKAAQRGRLRTVRRGGTVLTTRAYIDAYRASRSAAGRRA